MITTESPLSALVREWSPGGKPIYLADTDKPLFDSVHIRNDCSSSSSREMTEQSLYTSAVE